MAWQAKYNALYEKIEKHADLVNEYFKVFWEAYTDVSKEKARLALRDNPNGLFNLREPEA